MIPPWPIDPLDAKLYGYLHDQQQLDLSYRIPDRFFQEHGYARKIPQRVPETPDREAWEISPEDFATELIVSAEMVRQGDAQQAGVDEETPGCLH